MSWRDIRNVTNMYECVFSSTKKRDIKASDVVFFFFYIVLKVCLFVVTVISYLNHFSVRDTLRNIININIVAKLNKIPSGMRLVSKIDFVRLYIFSA